MLKLETYTIKIPKLKLFGYHGCYEKEQKKGQNFEVDMEISLWLKDGGLNAVSDNIECALDYVEICNRIKEKFNNRRYNLLESIAENLSEIPYNLEIENNDDWLENKKRTFAIGESAAIFLVEVRIRKNNPEGMDVPYIEIEYSNPRPKILKMLENPQFQNG